MRLATGPLAKLTPMSSTRTNRLLSPMPRASSTTVSVDPVAQFPAPLVPAAFAAVLPDPEVRDPAIHPWQCSPGQRQSVRVLLPVADAGRPGKRRAGLSVTQVDQTQLSISAAADPAGRRFASVFAERVLWPTAWAAADPAD